MGLLWIPVAAAVLVFLYVLIVGIICQRQSALRDDPVDYNFDPEKDDPETFPTYGKTPYRVAARESNIWWNSQPLERHTIRSYDGLTLVGHLLRAPNAGSDQVALVIHGHRCVSGEMGFIGRMYHQRGYHVFIPDQRAHGKSGGKYIGFGGPESRDMTGWLGCIHELFPDASVVLHGISMGAATVMMMAERSLPDYVVCAVEDCGYTTANDSIWVESRKVKPKLILNRTFIFVAAILNYLLTGVYFGRNNCVRALKKSRLPMLFIHGTADTVVPFSMLEPLYEAHPGPKQKLAVPDAMHGVAYFQQPELYEKTVFDFLGLYEPNPEKQTSTSA